MEAPKSSFFSPKRPKISAQNSSFSGGDFKAKNANLGGFKKPQNPLFSSPDGFGFKKGDFRQIRWLWGEKKAILGEGNGRVSGWGWSLGPKAAKFGVKNQSFG